ncbi:Histone deacetylase 4 [Frankliniella fusca]|uniref:Histone deacetylase 4 n=1 Tax=Frankliniella fusca TaxID=407009 RepID=A0AAE1H6I9_9NEOP|nr:Histone deacetylase 4 [Frankliniella fusca]
MSFLTSLQQFVSSGVASLSLTQRRFSLSRESSSEAEGSAGGAGAGAAGHALGHGPGLVAQTSLPGQPPVSPRRDSGSRSPHHGFPKVVPTAGAMLGRRRTLDGPPVQGLMLPSSPRRTSSFRHQHNQLQQQHQQHQQQQEQQRLLAMQQVQALRNHVFCRRRPSWPEVDPRATSG